MMEAGNERSLGGAVIIVAAFTTTNYGETDISRWGCNRTCAGAGGQSTKLAVCASLPKRNKDFLAYCLPRIFTFLGVFCLSFLNTKSDTFISVSIRVNTIFVISFIIFEISPTRCNNYVFILRNGFYSTCFGRQSHPSSEVHILYMATGKPAHLGCKFVSCKVVLSLWSCR
jgi:hypothetical protein